VFICLRIAIVTVKLLKVKLNADYVRSALSLIRRVDLLAYLASFILITGYIGYR